MTWVIAGLGNPGPQYETTRHNAGFLFLDILRDTVFPSSSWKEQKAFECQLAQGKLGTEAVILLKPHTFMNLSGRSVQRVLQFYKVAPQNLLVIYDDVDCPPGAVKMRMDGGHGGHNGIRSIIECLGTNQFPRIKLGVGKPEKGDGGSNQTAAWVLGQMTDQELEILQTKMFEEGLARLKSIVLQS